MENSIDEQENIGPTSGRRIARESRAREFRCRLVAWKQTPKHLRPTLRALARELGTSHQLLRHYLEGLEKWLYEERYNNAKQQSESIRARAKTESRSLTPGEEQQVREYDRAAIRALLIPALGDTIKRMKRASERVPLNSHQINTLKRIAPFFQEARDLLQARTKKIVK